MPDHLIIRRGEPRDLEGILGLVRLSLGDGAVPRTPEFWEWKHRRNPFGPSPCLVAEHGGNLVGLRIFLRWRWASGSEEVAALRAVDTAIHPAWRRRGIFSRLTRQLCADLEDGSSAFVFNTPNRQSRPGYLKMGWREVGRAPLLARPAGGRGLVRSLLGRRPTRPPDLGEFPSARELLAGSDLAALLEGFAGGQDPRYRTSRDRDYLAWRYAEIPGVDYRALWEGSGEGAGAIIFRGRVRRGLREVAVSEVLTSPDPAGPRTAARLLRELARNAGTDYCAAVAARATPERAALRRAGFLPAPGLGRRLTVRPLAASEGPPDPLVPGSWRLSLGDLEIL